MPRKPRYLEGFPLDPHSDGFRCPGIAAGLFPKARMPSDPSLRPATSISASSLLPSAMRARLGRKVKRALDRFPLGPQGGGCPSIAAGSLLPFKMGVSLGREVERALERTEEDDPSHRRIRKRRKETREKVRGATRR